MNHRAMHRKAVRHAALGSALVLSFGALYAAPASADILDAYVGAGLGQSQIRADIPNVASFKENHSAWTAYAGLRVISLLGAEVAYRDFGNPSGTIGGQTVRADLTGKSVSGLVYLPIPAPIVDVFGKAGYTRLNGSVTNGSNTLRTTLDDDVFSYGGGVQLKFGGFGVRGEYERFAASGRDPSLWTISVAAHFF
jgi:outer membrane protein with beta-barrel domain